MADDIVTRLRLWASAVPEKDAVIEELHKAADEIERLRKLVTESGKSLSHLAVIADLMQKSEDELIEIHHGKCAEQFEKQGNKIERLQADRDRWRATAEVLARELGKVEYANAEWHNQEGLH